MSVVIRNRDFRHLFLAQLVMFGGDWFVMIPLLGLLQRLTGHGLLGGLTLAADTGIAAVLLPYAGAIVDRLDRRKIMITANLGAIGAVSLLFIVHSRHFAWLGPVAVGAVAVAKAFYSPAAQAATPNLVAAEDLTAATAVAGAAWGTMTVLGASLGGVLAGAFNPYVCFTITAAGLAVAAVLAMRVRCPMQSPRDSARPAQPPGSAIRESLGYLRRQPIIRALVTVKSAVGLGNGVLVVYPVLAVLLDVGNLGTGLFFAVRGAGSLCGPLLLRRLLVHRPRRLFTGLALSMAAYGLSYLGVATLHWFPAVLGLILVAHAAGGGNWAMSSAALQARVPDVLRGRVFATDLMLATLAVAASQILVGFLVDHVDPWLLVGVCGSLTLVYSIGWQVLTSRAVHPEPLLSEPAAP